MLSTIIILSVGFFVLGLCKLAANADKLADKHAREIVRKYLKQKEEEDDANKTRDK
tara:strand:- start:11630 stop:11797 length:168 start_codon:yes stop_codon:yes gene_type:complete